VLNSSLEAKISQGD